MGDMYTSPNPFESEAGIDRLILLDRIIDGVAARTNLPEDIAVFEGSSAGEQPYSRRLLPSAMDSLPVGNYAIGSPDATDPFFDRNIVVTQDAEGKYIEGMYQGLTANTGNSQALLAKLGYKYENAYGAAKSVPTPETVAHHAAKLGVDVRCFPDQGLIDSNDYLKTFSEGKYPISTGDAAYYAHDIQDDHITAMVLGGEQLKDALKHVAAEALSQGEDLDNFAAGIDQFTADVRGAVAPTENDRGKDYDKHVLFVGRGLGLSDDKISEIIEAARLRGREFGMDTY